MNKLALAAVVVTYHPTQDMVQRVRIYAEFLCHVIVVDNTEQAHADAFNSVSDVTYLPMGTNRGIGDALNVGVDHAAKLGFQSVLLLDQDSVLTRDAASSACSATGDNIGIVALRQALHGERKRPSVTGPILPEGCVDVPVTMTSGSILNVRAYRECGHFAAKLFIDYVDHDYCLRLRRSGYRIVQCMRATLDHQLGDPKTVTLMGFSTSFVTHRPLRSYYIVRNGLYVVTKYFADDPMVALGVIKVLGKEFLKAVTVENEKLRRLRYMGLGFWHWLLNRYGKVAL